MGSGGSARPQSGPWVPHGSEARQMPAASCTSLAPFRPQFSSPRRSPPSSSTQSCLERGTHPRGAWPPSCAGSRPWRAHTLVLASNLPASIARSPRRESGGGEPAQATGWRRGGIGPQAAGSPLGGRLPGRLRLCDSAREEPAGCTACPHRHRRSAGPQRSTTMWCCLGTERSHDPSSCSFSHSPSASLSLARPVMSGGGRG